MQFQLMHRDSQIITTTVPRICNLDTMITKTLNDRWANGHNYNNTQAPRGRTTQLPGCRYVVVGAATAALAAT